MNIRSYALVVGLASCLFAGSVSAEGTSRFTLTFRGQIVAGPLEGYKFVGSCSYDANGDPLVQTGDCRVTASGPNKERLDLRDRRAYVGVTGDGLLLQITLGLVPRTASPEGNQKIATFTNTTIFKEAVTLLGPFPPFVAASFSVLGTTASSQDILIYEILGPDVHSDY